MTPLVTWNSHSNRIDYHGPMPRKPQRWRIVVRAENREARALAERDIRAQSPVHLRSLIKGTVLPMIDEAIAEARQTINEALAVENSEETHEIACAFEIFKWR